MNNKTPILMLAAVAASALSLAIGASPAVARTTDQIRVSYQELNLSSAAGRAVLDRRIGQAARQACGEFAPVELRWRAMSSDCQRELTQTMLAQVGGSAAAGGR